MKHFIFFFFIFGTTSVFSQELILKDSLKIEIQDSITDFGADDFHNIYFIRNFSELIKIDAKTQKVKTFSNHSVLENLNTQNILQITLKSGFFNLLVLDNQLNKVQDPIEFPIETNFSPTLIALVDNNYLWGYDPVLQRLVLWSYSDKKAIRQSVILSEKTGDEFYSDLIYQDNKIFLAGYHKILGFDEYANLEAVIPFFEFDQISIRKGNIFYSHENKLFHFDLRTQEKKEVPLGFGFDYFSINNRYLFALKDKVVYIYDFQNFL